MPYISVRVAGTLTREQKEKIADQFSQTMKDVCDKPREANYIVFDEVPRENWAKGEKLLG
jgi:4-oxalocrotonate tautomerase